MRHLAFSSGLTVLVNIYIFAVIATGIATKAADNTLPQSCLLSFGRGDVAMFSAMMQAVTIQMCVLPMYNELQDRSPEKFRHIVRVAFSCLFVIFGCFAVAGQFSFGEIVQSNVLLDLPGHVWGKVAQFGAVVSIMSVYPIMMSPMVAPVRNSARLKPYTALATVFIVLVSAGGALLTTNLGLLNVVNGAACVGVFVGLLPGVTGLYLLERPRLPMFALMFLAITMCALGFFYTNNYATDNAKHCIWPLQ